MYIAPNSIVRLLHNCPLDTTYEHTVYFADATAQANYFASLSKYTLSPQTYQRVANSTGRMRVAQLADNLYDCNYMMFQNTSFGNKWFYAFIKSVEYVNNATAEIQFELDVMQTWFFDYTLRESYVSREHAATDAVGDNTVPESLELGGYKINSSEIIAPAASTGNYIVFYTSFLDDATLSIASGAIVDRTYCGLNILWFSSASAANNFLDNVIAANKLDGIVGAYMCPWQPDVSAAIDTDTVTVAKQQSTLDGYTPRNKKLLTYPYNLLHIHSDTNSGDFRYEWFDGASCIFNLYYGVVPEPAMSLIPMNYTAPTGTPANGQTEYRITVSNYPQCAFNADVFKIYMAQMGVAMPVKKISDVVQPVVSAVYNAIGMDPHADYTGISVDNPLEQILAAGMIKTAQYTKGQNTVANELARVQDLYTRPPQSNGTQTSSLDYGMGVKTLTAQNLTIKAEFARIIDDYFDKYGYATHRVKVPNRHVRANWTYTKTVGCVAVGSVPSDDMNRICRIYDKGITFWTNGANVGNYALANGVI